jgi:hypothetical protein
VAVGPLFVLDVLVLPGEELTPRSLRHLESGPRLQHHDDLARLHIALDGECQLVAGFASSRQHIQLLQGFERFLVDGLDYIASLESGLGGGTGDGHLRDAHALLRVRAEDADVDPGPLIALPQRLFSKDYSDLL